MRVSYDEAAYENIGVDKVDKQDVLDQLTTTNATMVENVAVDCLLFSYLT